MTDKAGPATVRCSGCGLVALAGRVASHQQETGHTDSEPMCRKGLHAMTPDNSIVQRSTGRTSCRECRLAYKREQTRLKPGCTHGHSYAVAGNSYRTRTGQIRCAVCQRKKAAARERAKFRKITAAADDERRAAAAAAAAKAAAVTPRVRGGGKYGNETDARYRLALMVRRGRT